MQPNLFTGAEALAVRKKLKLNQSDFWRPLLVAQSCGSRYESGREIPGPVQVLLCIRYGTKTQKRKALQILTMEALQCLPSKPPSWGNGQHQSSPLPNRPKN